VGLLLASRVARNVRLNPRSNSRAQLRCYPNTVARQAVRFLSPLSNGYRGMTEGRPYSKAGIDEILAVNTTCKSAVVMQISRDVDSIRVNVVDRSGKTHRPTFRVAYWHHLAADSRGASETGTVGPKAAITRSDHPRKEIKAGAMGNAKKTKITVFLIKDGYTKIDEFLSFKDFRVVPIHSGGKEVGTLIYKGGFQSRPPWVSIFEGVSGFDARGIYNQSSKAVLVLKHGGRWFCFTFGYARHLIDELAYERNFGLITSLNLAEPSSIKSIDKTNVGLVSLRSREQATKEIPLASFEFKDDVDLLRSVTAKLPPSEDEEQETVSGRDSVTIYTVVSVEAFAEIASRLYAAFQSTRYKKKYPWLGKIREERDLRIIEALDARLAESIFKKDFEKIWLAIPELVAWEEIEGFAFGYRSEDPKKAGPILYQDLDIESWRQSARVDASLSAKQLKTKRIYVYWQDGREPTTWSVYRCLNAEVDHDRKKYILNDGDWYNIEGSFVNEVQQFYAAIPTSKIALPPYGTKTEPEYLKAAAAGNPSFALMDRKEVMIGGGRSRVEFCDLYSSKREIIHVKRYGGANLLSHLFSQATVSGECFLHEAAFRMELNKLLPPTFRLANPNAQPRASEYEVCMAVMSRVKGPLELPFFSKVSLKHAVRSLQNFGYRVTKLKVSQ